MGYFAPELLGYIVAEWWRTFVGISKWHLIPPALLFSNKNYYAWYY
jgi:hypothetical protein